MATSRARSPRTGPRAARSTKVDRVEWLYTPDAMTNAATLNAGEADWWENPPLDVVPVLAANPDVVIAPTDPLPNPIAHSQALVVTDLIKKLGLNVELQAMDWGTLVTRRASMEPTDKGGWNIFCTGWVGADLLAAARAPGPLPLPP